MKGSHSFDIKKTIAADVSIEFDEIPIKVFCTAILLIKNSGQQWQSNPNGWKGHWFQIDNVSNSITILTDPNLKLNSDCPTTWKQERKREKIVVSYPKIVVKIHRHVVYVFAPCSILLCLNKSIELRVESFIHKTELKELKKIASAPKKRSIDWHKSAVSSLFLCYFLFTFILFHWKFRIFLHFVQSISYRYCWLTQSPLHCFNGWFCFTLWCLFCYGKICCFHWSLLIMSRTGYCSVVIVSV